jgi:polyhydroxyalkanoate synthesis regulator phasin
MSDLRSLVQESWSKAVLAASSVEEQAQELLGKLTQAFQVEDVVRRGLDRLSPTRAELRELTERVKRLEQRVARLQSNTGNPA